MKAYVRKGFEDKIKLNLGRICASENDKFSFVRAEYTRDFTCELCEHQHLSMCFWVKNVSTNLIIKVGSECIHHFSLPQSDLDKADALRKHLERSIEEGRAMKVHEFGVELFNKLPEEIQNKRYFLQSELHDIMGDAYNDIPESSKKGSLGRDDVIDILGNEKFKALPRGEKFDLINNIYKMSYAERLLDEVASGEHFLSKEEVEQIVTSTENGEARIAASEARAKAKAEAEAARKAYYEKQKEIGTLTAEIRMASAAAVNTLTDLDPTAVAAWMTRAAALGVEAIVERSIQSTTDIIAREKAYHTDYDWLLSYIGTNSFLIDLKRNLQCYHSLTAAQTEAGKKALDLELNPPAPEEEDAGAMLDKLIAKYPGNTFYRGLASQWRYRHSLSPKQMDCVRRDYAKKL